MKKEIALIVALVILTAGSSFAAGFRFINNPDRYPSLGFSLGVTDIDGPNTRVLLPSSAAPVTDVVNTTQKTQDLTVDLRLPVSHALTVFGAFSVVSQELTSNNGNFALSNDGTFEGFGFRLGARYYFNR